jgi:hypothetical protein
MCTTTQILGDRAGHRVANLIFYFWVYFSIFIYLALVIGPE